MSVFLRFTDSDYHFGIFKLFINVKQTNVTTDNFCCSNHKLTITGCIIGNNQQTGTVLVVCYLLVSIPMKHCFYNDEYVNMHVFTIPSTSHFDNM
jgi:hypothetical protein